MYLEIIVGSLLTLMWIVYIQPRFIVQWISNRYPDVIFNFNVKSRMIALTIDDGPSNNTPHVLDILKKHDVKATFFVIGSQIAGNEHIIQR